jgi:hypothetical protein
MSLVDYKGHCDKWGASNPPIMTKVFVRKDGRQYLEKYWCIDCLRIDLQTGG